ncbi:MAG TPA: MMPL family transporter [Gaiellaceae bacterium]|nr:MMPL family transporter [Gaiellaceae bacterium]
MPEPWTRGVIRFRVPVLAAWLAVLVLGLVASFHLSHLLADVFTVPGTESDRARVILQRDFGERPDGVFTVVFRGGPGILPQARRRLAAAAAIVPTAHASPLHVGRGIVYGEIDSVLDLQTAKGYTERIRRALAGTPRAYVTGQPAIQHDLEPVLSGDLHRGEAIALPIALLVLLAVLGLSAAVVVPFLFAGCTIFGSLAVLWLVAHGVTMVSYVTNLVELVGLGLAIDYSLLVVSRFREELVDDDVDGAVVRTMATAGRAVIFSGATVAVGLALLLFVPVPFIRSLGIGGFLVPLLSLAASSTLQPALLSLLGRRAHGRAFRADGAFWHRLAGTIMRRPWPFLVGGATLLVVAAIPAAWMQLTPGSVAALPAGPEAVTGLRLLHDEAGPGALTPTELVVVRASPQQVAQLVRRARRDPETVVVAPGGSANGYRRIYVVNRHEYGAEATQAFVRRLRGYVPPGAEILAGGGPPQGVDYLDRSYAWLPWLVLGALALTYLLLLRAFRSLLLPLKAVVLNVLSVAATYGLLVVVFRWGLGSAVLGLHQVPQVEGWIPIFLFAMLFGLSMDYEVFLVTRMREAWDETHDNTYAVALGLERTGRIITAAALIMVAAFCGFLAGRIAGLQEFGAGLAMAIALDATIVRMLLVPALMAVLGRWNWWLPGATASRAVRSRA